MLEADRGHTGVGGWDLMLPDDDRLDVMAELVRTEPTSYVHHSTFLVAELDTEPAAAVASYVPGETTIDLFYEACARVLDWEPERIQRAHVGTYIGNEPAVATYRRAGFEVFAEGRHADYEARVGAPGVVFLRRTLP